MALADTANLLVKMNLGGNFLSQIGKSTKGLTNFDRQLGKTESRAFKAGQQIGTGIKNAGRLAAVGVGLLVSQIGLGLNSLIELEKQTAQTNAVIKSTKGVAGITATEVGRLAEKFESLNATVGDEFIRAGENMLLTFTNLRGKAFEPAVKAILDMNTAMGKGPEGLTTTAILVGKALNDPIKGATALRRVGVQLNDQQIKQIKTLIKQNKLYDAQQIILKELNTEFGGSFIAGGNTTAGKVAKFTDSIEDLQRALAEALLPTLGNVADALSSTLADPKVVEGVRQFGKSLADLVSPGNLAEAGKVLQNLFSAAKEAAPTLAAAAKTMGAVVKTAVSLFQSLPPEIQKLAIGAFAVNKLTGGLVTNLASGLIGGVLKQLVSGVVNVRGATVLVSGGVGGAGGVGAAGAVGAASVWSKIGKIIGGAFLIATVAELADVLHSAITPFGGLEGRTNAGKLLPADQLSWPFGPKNTPRWVVDTPFGQLNLLGGDSTFAPTPGLVGNLGHGPMPRNKPSAAIPGPKFAGNAQALSVIASRGEKAGFHPTDAAILATFKRNTERLAAVSAAAAEKAATKSAVAAESSRQAAFASRDRPQVIPAPLVTVNVSVSPTGIVNKNTVITRSGPAGSSRETSKRFET